MALKVTLAVTARYKQVSMIVVIYNH